MNKNPPRSKEMLAIATRCANFSAPDVASSTNPPAQLNKYVIPTTNAVKYTPNINVVAINQGYNANNVPPISIIPAAIPTSTTKSSAVFVEESIFLEAKLNAPTVNSMNAPKATENANAPKTNGAYNVIIVPPNSIIPPDIKRSLANSLAFMLASSIPLVAKLNAPTVDNINTLRAAVNPNISPKWSNTYPPIKAPNKSKPEAATTIVANEFRFFSTFLSIAVIPSLSLLMTLFSIVTSVSIANAPKYASGIVTPTTASIILMPERYLRLSFIDSRFFVFLISSMLLICAITLLNAFTFLDISISFAGIDANAFK